MRVHTPGKSEHFAEGYRARVAGKSVMDCPHHAQHSMEFMDWVLGWNEANQNAGRPKH
jgi:ribosome modulation factor